MSEGRKAGIALAFGIAAGSLSWSLLSVLGLSAVLATYAAALIAIKIIHFYRRARRSLQASFGAFFIYAGGRLLTERS